MRAFKLLLEEPRPISADLVIAEHRRVAGVAGARARDPVPDAKSLQSFATLNDDTRRAVPGNLELEQLAAHELDGATHTDAGDFALELFHVQGIAGILHDKRGRPAVRHER